MLFPKEVLSSLIFQSILIYKLLILVYEIYFNLILAHCINLMLFRFDGAFTYFTLPFIQENIPGCGALQCILSIKLTLSYKKLVCKRKTVLITET